MYQPAFPCSELEDAISWALPIPPGWIQRVLQESLGPDVVEEKGTLAGAHCHNVLIETHRSDPCMDTDVSLMQSYSKVNINPPCLLVRFTLKAEIHKSL